MFNKISLITSLLFFLLGTNVFAHLEDTSTKNGEVLMGSSQNIILASADNKELLTNDETMNRMDQAVLLTKKEKSEADEPSFKDYVVPGLVGIIIVVGFGSYWLIYRRKQT